MDKQTIRQLCARILGAANVVQVSGEENMAQIMGICRAARQIATELEKETEGEKHG